MRRPRVRDAEAQCQRRLLPLFKRKRITVDAAIPILYLQGLAQGDCTLALRGLLGDQTPVSSTTVARLKVKWHAELAAWQSRSFDDVEVVSDWVDGIDVAAAGVEKDNAAL